MNPGRSYRTDEYRPQFGGFSFFPPVVKYLLITNVAMFIVQWMVMESGLTFQGVEIGYWFATLFYLYPIGEGFQIWQLVTYMFLHGGLGHIFMNMLMLWMFGMEVENLWGSKKFLIFYFVSGIAAGLANLFIAPIFTSTGPTVGASGGVYGVLVAFAMMFPNRYIFLYFFVPVRAKYLITFFIVLELFNGVLGTQEGIAHMAHLGGALVGALWVLLDSRGVIDRLLRKVDSRTARGEMFTDRSKTREATFYDISSSAPKPPLDERSASQKVIDEILDKISVSGYGSLTEEEKRILLEASRRIHPDQGRD
ncbi:MAG TPA: rhomboid family intramembrane serine protease [Bacteroidota bacterium]|nr:rhomboid family intramembrane serine protease [Bacteroidota bacterium]